MIKLRKFFQFTASIGYRCFDYHVKGTEREVSVVRVFIYGADYRYRHMDETDTYKYVVWYKDGGSRDSASFEYKGEKPGTLVRRHMEHIGAPAFPFIGGIYL